MSTDVKAFSSISTVDPEPETLLLAAQRHRAKIDAIPAAEIEYVYADPIPVVKTVLNAVKRFMVFRARMDKLSSELDLEQIDNCASYARAYWYLSSKCAEHEADQEGIAELYAEGIKRRDVFEIVRSGLGKAEVTHATQLRALTGIAGKDNVARDLVKHVVFFRDHWSVVEGKVPITAADLDRSEWLAQALVNADESKGPSTITYGSNQLAMYQAGTLFLRAYSEVRRAISFIRARQGDADEIAPPIYSGRTPPTRKQLEQPAVVAPSAPAVAPAATPVVTTSAVDADIPPGFKGSSPFTS